MTDGSTSGELEDILNNRLPNDAKVKKFLDTLEEKGQDGLSLDDAVQIMKELLDRMSAPKTELPVAAEPQSNVGEYGVDLTGLSEEECADVRNYVAAIRGKKAGG